MSDIAHESVKKKLKVDLEDLSILMETNRLEHEVYFDTQTGETLHIPMELNEDNVYDEVYVHNLPDWEKEMVEDAKAVYEDLGERFILIPEKANYEEYEVMVKFIHGLKNVRLAEELFEAIDGKGAFRRFKNTIGKHPKVEKDWYAFKDEVEKQDVKEWLESIGVDPIEG